MRALLLVGVLSVAAVTALAALGWPASAYRHTDFVQWWLAGRSVFEGWDPYDTVAWRAAHERVGSRGLELVLAGAPFAYPYYVAALAVPFALLPFELAAPAWLASQVALAGAALAALARRALAPRLVPLLLGLTFLSQPMGLLAGGGNMGGFLLAIVAAGTALLLGGRPLAAGAVMALLAVKPTPFLLFGPLLLLPLGRRERARLVTGAAITGTALLAVSLALRPEWLARWRPPTALLTQDLARANVWGLLRPEPALGWIAAIAAVALVLWWWRARGPSLVAFASGALAVALFTSPYLWSYDHLALFAATVPLLGLADRARPRALALALVAAVAVTLPWLLRVAAVATGSEGWSGATPLAFLVALVGLDLSARAPRMGGDPRPATR